jgi:octanoyl-[GcvH]:protein N-octanoyltransferase
VAPLRLIVDARVADPVFDAAISRALLLRVADGELGDTLRLSRPGPSVAFGRRDVVGDGYAAAIEAARAAGFEPTERLAGGRAAAFHEQTIHIGHSVRAAEPRRGVGERFEQAAACVADALRGLGVDARVGEVEGEYCPGAHSVNARGAVKLMGVGQRVVRKAAHVGAVVVADGGERIRAALEPVYAALALDWRPDTTGSVAAELPGATWEKVRAAVQAQYAARWDVVPAELDAETLALAERLAPEHESAVPIVDDDRSS